LFRLLFLSRIFCPLSLKPKMVTMKINCGAAP
jgi:hypothetical protein